MNALPDTDRVIYYIAGPMSHKPLFNFPAFKKVAASIRAKGHGVVSPAELDVAEGFNPAIDKAGPMRDYMKRDLPALLGCDAVAVLPGWEGSKGARIEVAVAEACGIAVVDAATLEPLAVPESETILQESQRIVYGDRAKQYAHPKVHFARTVGMLNALGFRRHRSEQAVSPLTPHDWADAMMVDKLARRANDPEHRDSLVDIAGYAATAERLQES